MQCKQNLEGVWSFAASQGEIESEVIRKGRHSSGAAWMTKIRLEVVAEEVVAVPVVAVVVVAAERRK